MKEADVRSRVEALIKLFEIRFDLRRYPYELSGGQMQTVCIMRSLATEPEVLFLDEPFSALDFEMTLFIRAKLQDAHMATGTTMVIVSHDLEDAVFLADRILLLTRRPTRIAELVSFDMPRPRPPEAVADPEFVRVKAHALEVFRREMNA
jgi:NitT/TauT family transport system ATP-binding protein